MLPRTARTSPVAPGGQLNFLAPNHYSTFKVLFPLVDTMSGGLIPNRVSLAAFKHELHIVTCGLRSLACAYGLDAAPLL